MSRRRGKPFKRERISEDQDYKAYLASTQWKEKRARLMAERGKRCEVCGDTDQLSVHHLTYVRLYDELDGDLLIVCGACHAGFHNRWGVVRAIGAKRYEAETRRRLERWRTAPREHRLSTSHPDSVESNEWNGYDPFANAASPVASYKHRATTPSLKDRF